MVNNKNPFYYKKHEIEINQKPYAAFLENIENDMVENYQDDETKHFIKLFSTFHLEKFIKNKVVIDAGSGLGKYLPLLSYFFPKKIYSVDQDEELCKIQKNFTNCVFPFLPNNKICENLEIINEDIVNFLKKDVYFDTLIFFRSWHLIDLVDLASFLKNDIIFYTHEKHMEYLYNCISKTNYKVVNKIKDDLTPNFIVVAKND